MNLKLIPFAALLLAAFATQAQTTVNAKIEKVTIYPHGALVEKSITVPLQKGENKFIVPGNALNVKGQQFHFESDPHWYVGSIQREIKSTSKADQLARTMPQQAFQQYTSLQNQIDDLTLRKSNLELLASTLQTQKDALSRLRALTNTQSFTNVDSLRLQFEFQRSEVQKINSNLDKANKDKLECIDKITKLSNERDALIRKYIGGSSVTSGDNTISFSIFSDRSVSNARISFSYKVSEVSCDYFYDVLLDEDAKNAIFVLKAQVNQNTRENWNNCPVVFSTIDAGQAGFDATLPTYYLDFHTAPAVRRSAKAGYFSNTVVMEAESTARGEDNMANTANKEIDIENEIMMIDPSMLIDPSMMSEHTLAREYALSTPQTIAWGDPAQTILLHLDTTPAIFARYATPKNEEKVHYTALLPNWEELGLRDYTSCNVYMNGHYISESHIVIAGSGDTLRFAVGEDHNVKVQRTLRRSTPNVNGLISKEIDLTATITLTIKNTRNEALSVSLKDQVPISLSPDIKITPNVGDGQLDEKTGIVRWMVDLKPLEQKTITFSYTVRVPKDKRGQITLN